VARRRLVGVIAAVLVALTAAVGPAAARPDPDGVVAEGLSDPRGISAAGGRALLVADSGSGKIVRIEPRRNGSATVTTFAQVSSNPEAAGPVEVAYQGPNHVWVTVSGDPAAGGARVVRLDRKGKVTVSVDIAAYQATDPDEDDQDDFPEESNPFGLALLPGGGVLVADSAGNDVLKIDQKRKITTVARFLREDVPWPDVELPFPTPPPGTPTPVESVPTAIAIGPDGAWYVSELKGFPFVKGTSRIWRIEPGAKNAVCDPKSPSTGKCTSYATGFTSVMDLAFGPDGTMYVLEIVKEGLLGAELLGEPPIGALWAVKGGTKTELATGTLLAPGGVAVGYNGTLSVTTGTVFGPGGGAVVRINP
jgi:sugar lactone lactonase YvrE